MVGASFENMAQYAVQPRAALSAFVHFGSPEIPFLAALVTQ
jgi:hypothetical protein